MATTGPVFQFILDRRDANEEINGKNASEVLDCLLKNCKVYARMSPSQKASLIKELQVYSNDMIGMCGDGANDCNALKVADVGLSLSTTEASIAAPFTSSVTDISSIVSLLKLGRSSLDMSYLIFKYMLVYSSMEFASVVILYFHTSSISDSQLLFIDFFCAAPITLFLCSLDEKERLGPLFPPASLLSPRVLMSLLGQMTIQGLFLIGIYFNLSGQNFFDANDKSSDIDNGKNFHISSLFRNSGSHNNIHLHPTNLHHYGFGI